MTLGPLRHESRDGVRQAVDAQCLADQGQHVVASQAAQLDRPQAVDLDQGFHRRRVGAGIGPRGNDDQRSLDFPHEAQQERPG